MLIGPSRGEGLAGAARAGRQHAIEHVDAALDRADDVVGLADAHQIARRVGGQLAGREIEAGEHRLLPLPDREPADRIAVEADLAQRVGRGPAQPLVERALLDAEHRARSAARRRDRTRRASASPSASSAPSPPPAPPRVGSSAPAGRTP